MNTSQLVKELKFKAVRSSGAGGQHVNKVSSKVELSFNIEDSLGLSLREKELLQKNLTSRLTKDGVLLMSCSESRSQHRNKELVIQLFFDLLKQKLIRPKIRRATKPTKASVMRKSEGKKRNSQKKAMRRKPNIE